ncbi:hypothetical protein [Bradyrhizobium jicamae]|uniref:hypothetical protein n=1 Tax=Bradyrhizobium jicamae TaxID=280332 RepID=UPI001BA4875D|nr:hypothetical protein [Bradyrhizobium jicamae]MBR0938807.1 hypothetical protein [Bradyrhizobium jicamae]
MLTIVGDRIASRRARLRPGSLRHIHEEIWYPFRPIQQPCGGSHDREADEAGHEMLDERALKLGRRSPIAQMSLRKSDQGLEFPPSMLAAADEIIG